MQFFPLDMTVADRWFYFPLVGLLGILGTGIFSIKSSSQKIKNVGCMFGILFLILFSLRTMVRNTNWYNALTLYAHDSNIATNYDLENNIGVEFALLKNYDEAIAHYEKSINVFPSEASYANIGYMYLQKNDLQKAKEYYKKALRAKNYSLLDSENHKHNLETYIRLSFILLRTEKVEITKDFVQTALTDYSDSDSLWALLALCDYEQNNYESALLEAKKAVDIDPTNENKYIYTQILNKQPIVANKDKAITPK
jgi:tetratricopeptide (TPR) repeat protein